MSRQVNQRLALGRVLIAIAVVTANCQGQSNPVLCDGGYGSFKWKSQTGVAVSVDAPKIHGFADHACQARLTWDKHELVIAPRAAQIDLDAVAVDLGLGTPVTALQIRKLDHDKFMTYEIYSLWEPPRQLRVITGGDWYSAADTDLDGHVEIWTTDAAAIDGFEEIPLSAFDFAPHVVLRFEGKRLIDVSSQFRPDYDRRIKTLRAQVDATQLSAFKQSDGTLNALFPPTPMEWARLKRTKIIVLEIVWCYLYSGRQQEAWSTLAEMWPVSDRDRIQAAIVDAHARGIDREVDAISSTPAPRWNRQKMTVYGAPLGAVEMVSPLNSRAFNDALQSAPTGHDLDFYADTPPIDVLLRRPKFPPGSENAIGTPIPLSVVVDSAGKVRSAKSLGRPDEDLIQSTADWKFIPAFKNGHPVACRFRTEVSPLQ
jgi:hypothetical protein